MSHPPGAYVVEVPRYSTSRPYNLFTKVNRPTLPTNLKNADREKLLGLMWQALSKEGKAAYQRPRPPQATREGPNRQGSSRKGAEARAARRASYGWFDEGPTKSKWTGGEWFTQAERWARAKQAEDDAPAPEVLVPPPAKRRAAAEGVAVCI